MPEELIVVGQGDAAAGAAGGDGDAAAGAADAGSAASADADAGDAAAGQDAAADAGAASDAGATQRREPTGAVKELIDLRKTTADLRTQLDQLQRDPVLTRMTPEMRQAVLEGRIVVGPPAGSREAEAQRLTAVADRYGLYKVDAQGNQVPDLEAAERVDAGIRQTVREEMAPLQTRTLQQQAQANINAAWDASVSKLPADAREIVHAEITALMGTPNAAQLLSQPAVLQAAIDKAIGSAFRAGKLTVAQVAAAAAGGGAPTAEPSPAPATGRRAPGQAAIQLSAPVAAVYKNAGIDPAKSFSSTLKPTTNPHAIELE